MPQSAPKTDVVVLPPAAAAASPGTTITVQEALAAIRQDSHAAPATYLDDTEVPHGGE